MTVDWREGAFGGVTGYVGKLRLFTRSWTTRRGDEQPWKLRSDLPGLVGKQWSYATIEECEAKAEELLRQFAAYLWANGVRFPTQEEAAPDGR